MSSRIPSLQSGGGLRCMSSELLLLLEFREVCFVLISPAPFRRSAPLSHFWSVLNGFDQFSELL